MDENSVDVENGWPHLLNSAAGWWKQMYENLHFSLLTATHIYKNMKCKTSFELLFSVYESCHGLSKPIKCEILYAPDVVNIWCCKANSNKNTKIVDLL